MKERVKVLKAIISRVKPSTMILLGILVAAVAVTTLATARCHISFQSGLHCHASEAPHVHPFANH